MHKRRKQVRKLSRMQAKYGRYAVKERELGYLCDCQAVDGLWHMEGLHKEIGTIPTSTAAVKVEYVIYNVMEAPIVICKSLVDLISDLRRMRRCDGSLRILGWNALDYDCEQRVVRDKDGKPRLTVACCIAVVIWGSIQTQCALRFVERRVNVNKEDAQRLYEQRYLRDDAKQDDVYDEDIPF